MVECDEDDAQPAIRYRCARTNKAATSSETGARTDPVGFARGSTTYNDGKYGNHPHRRKEIPLRKGRRGATRLERTIEDDEPTNRLRFVALDKTGSATPSERTGYVTRHCDKIAYRTRMVRRGRFITFVLLIMGIARRMSMIGQAVRGVIDTWQQTMQRVSKQERRDRQNDHDKHCPVFESEAHHSAKEISKVKSTATSYQTPVPMSTRFCGATNRRCPSSD